MIISNLVKWLLSLVVTGITAVMDFFIKLFSTTFGADTKAFLHTFPIASDFAKTFIAIGFSLCMLFVVMALFRNIFSGLGFAGENPFKMVIRFIIAIFIVVYMGTFMTFIFENTFKEMYSRVMDTEMGVREVGATLAKISEPNGFASAAAAGAVENGVIIQLVIALIFIILIGLNLFKLLIEMVERYLMVNVLIFFAPLAGSAVTLESTMKVFQTYCKMFFGQLMMLLLNVVSLKLVGSGLTQLSKDLSVDFTSTTPEVLAAQTTVFADILLIVAFLKIAQRFDNYLRDLGVTVGITGGNLTDEILTAGKTVTHAVGNVFGGKGGKGGGKGGLLGKLPGGVAGAAALGTAAAGPLGGIVGGGVKMAKDAAGNAGSAFKNTRAGGVMDGAKYGEAFHAVGVATKPNSIPAMISPASAARRAEQVRNTPLRNQQQAMTGAAAKNAVTGLYRDKFNATAAKVGTDASVFKGKNGHWYRATSEAPASDIGVSRVMNSVTGQQDYIQDLSALDSHSMAQTGEHADLYTQSIKQFNDKSCHSMNYTPPETATAQPTPSGSPTSPSTPATAPVKKPISN